MNLAELSSPCVSCLPGLAKRDAFTIAGPSGHFDAATKSEIPAIWPTLIAALPLRGQVESWESYGLVWNGDPATGHFDYMAGVPVTPGSTLPAGFTEQQVPAATYVVFRITLNAGSLHVQIKSAMAAIWGVLLPASGLRLAKTPHFEFYDGRFKPDQPGSQLDFFVPVLDTQA